LEGLSLEASRNPLINEVLVLVGGAVLTVMMGMISYLVKRMISSNDKLHEKTGRKLEHLEEHVTGEIQKISGHMSEIERKFLSSSRGFSGEFLQQQLTKTSERVRTDVLNKVEAGQAVLTELKRDFQDLKSDIVHKQGKTEIILKSVQKDITPFIDLVPVVKDTRSKVDIHDQVLDQFTKVLKAQNAAIKDLRARKKE
jgi:gas vesicle protein